MTMHTLDADLHASRHLRCQQTMRVILWFSNPERTNSGKRKDCATLQWDLQGGGKEGGGEGGEGGEGGSAP